MSCVEFVNVHFSYLWTLRQFCKALAVYGLWRSQQRIKKLAFKKTEVNSLARARLPNERQDSASRDVDAEIFKDAD